MSTAATDRSKNDKHEDTDDQRRSAQIGGHGEKSSRTRERAISALLARPTIAQAAKAVGVADSTLRGWMKAPAFRKEYVQARRELLDGAIGRLQSACAEAVGVLRDVAQDGKAPPATRVSAAKAILDSSFRGLDVLDLTERLEALEAQAEQRR